jgi:hypothetical protein
MELEELKKTWAQYDQKLSENLKLNEELLRSINFEKYSHALKKPYYLELFSIAVESFMFIIVTISSIRMIGEFQFSIPGFAGALLCMISMIFSIITVKRIEKLFVCDSSIIEHQKELLRLKAFVLRIRRFAYIIAPLLGLLIMPVFIKTVSNLNIYDRPEFLLLICFSVVLGLILGTWLNISVYDKGIRDAERFLKEITKFEKDE